MAVRIPILKTERLILRGHELRDLAECVAMWSDPAVIRHIGGKPSTRQQTWSRMLNYGGHWHMMGFGYWAVEEKSTGEYIGEMGFADFKREMQPSIAGTPELGWALCSHAHGKGYATEALKAVVAWGDDHFARARTVCIIDPGNLASIRVAEKIGFHRVQETSYAGQPIVLFERLPHPE